MSRTELFLTAVGFLQAGHSVSVAGERLSGRTHLLSRVREHFITLGWRVISVAGREPLEHSAYSALAMAGIVSWPDHGAVPTARVFRALEDAIVARRTIILVDDVEWVDESSWAALIAVSAHNDVPLMTARALHRHANPSPPVGGIGPIYALELPPMSYAELEIAVESALGEKVEPATLSRLFSKAGGNIGMALTIVESARRTGRMVADEGTLRAVDALWNPALTGFVEDLLGSLTIDERSAMRTLALLGPANLRTAERLVAASSILELESKHFVEVVETRDGPLVTVRPPLVAEFFRHESPPGQRVETLARIDNSLAGSLRERPVEVEGAGTTALFVRLAHERTRRATLTAREGWRKNPSLRSAAHLLNALGADSAHSSDEIAALIAAANRLSGPQADRAQWEIAHARHAAHHQGRWSEAVARLQEAEVELSSSAPRLRAEAFLLGMGTGAISVVDPLTGVELDQLDDDTRFSGVLGRAAWLLARGRIIDADALMTQHDSLRSDDPRLHAVVVYGKLGLGQFALAARIASDKAEEARERFDAPRVRAYEYLLAFSSIFTREFGVAETAINAANALGVPAGETPASYLGLTVLSAFFAAERGQRTAVAELTEDVDAAGLRDGALPGLHRSFALIRLAMFDGDREGARRIAREAGDELWDRGAFFGAAFCYLDGLRAAPNLEDWEHAHERIGVVDSPAVKRWASFTRALVRRDPHELIRAVQEVAEKGESADAAEFARIARETLGPRGAEEDVISALDRIAESDHRPSPRDFVELSARELEVAELVASGLSNPMIAEALVVSVRTVESHVNKLIKKIGARSRSDIRNYLIEVGVN